MSHIIKEDGMELVDDRIDKCLTDMLNDLSTQLEKMKSDLIKWMFLFWAGQTVIITGVVLTLVKAK